MSSDGRYYALAHIQPDHGAMACPLSMKLEIVDSKTDKWVRGTGYERSDSQNEDECQYKSIQEIETDFQN